MSKQQFTTEAAGAVAVTVVVSTRNRCDKIEACVRALAALRCRLAWQCVIIDNGSSDGTLERLRELATVLSPRLEIVSEPRAGVSRGRNAGIRAARGEFIAMTDDDCLPDSDFLDAVLEVFADPAIGYYGGRVLLHDPADYPITIKTSMQREEFPPGTVLRPGVLHRRELRLQASSARAHRVGSIRPWVRAPAPVRRRTSSSRPARRSRAGAASTIRDRRCGTTMADARPIPSVRWIASTTWGAAPITCVPRCSMVPGYWHSSIGTGAWGSRATAVSGGSPARRSAPPTGSPQTPDGACRSRCSRSVVDGGE